MPNMIDIEKISIKEFCRLGYLQELNRQFLHPLGMALETTVDEMTGEEKLGGVWDFRDDPEGISYTDELVSSAGFIEKANFVQDEINRKAPARESRLGFVTQPVPEKEGE